MKNVDSISEGAQKGFVLGCLYGSPFVAAWMLFGHAHSMLNAAIFGCVFIAAYVVWKYRF